MNLDYIGYIVTFVSGVGSLIIFLQIRSMYNKRQEVKKKKEMAMLLGRLRISNELLIGAKKLPFSKVLHTCLYQRHLSILEAITVLEPENIKLLGKTEYIKDKLRILSTSSTVTDKRLFQVPANEIEAIELIKLIKKFRAILRSARMNGYIKGREFAYENTRLDAYQTRIIIGNLIKRANYAIEHKQKETAQALINQGINFLNSKSGTQPIDTIVESLTQLESLNDKLSGEYPLHELISINTEETEEEVDNELNYPTSDNAKDEETTHSLHTEKVNEETTNSIPDNS